MKVSKKYKKKKTTKKSKKKKNKDEAIHLVEGKINLTTRMMQSFEDDATTALLELTARSVMSPFQALKENQSHETNDTKIMMTH